MDTIRTLSPHKIMLKFMNIDGELNPYLLRTGLGGTLGFCNGGISLQRLSSGILGSALAVPRSYVA